MKTTEKRYEAPQAEVIAIETQSVLCASAGSGGSGGGGGSGAAMSRGAGTSSMNMSEITDFYHS